MHKIQLIPLIISGLIAMAGSTAVYAQRPGDQNSFRNGNNGLNQAIRSTEQRTGGRVLSADKRRIDGQPKYRLKVLTPSGRVRIINIEAR